MNTIAKPTAAATHQTQVAAVSAPQAVQANRPRLAANSLSHPIAAILEAHRASVMMARLMQKHV